MKTLRLILFLYSALAHGASLENTSFSILSTEHGLSQKTALDIYQDSDGFIWIGTQEGLNRFDGKEIKIFRHFVSDQSSISNDVIKDIQQDQLGRLWVATNNGLNLFDATSQTFSVIEVTDQLNRSISRINTLYLDKNKRLLIGTDGMGAFEVVEQDDRFSIRALENTAHLSNADVRAFLRDSSGRLWVGTERQGLTLISGNQFLQFAANKNIKGSLSNNKVRDIYEDVNHTIWVATRGGGLNRFDELSQTFKSYRNQVNDYNSLTHDRVYKIFQDSQKRLWIATDGGVSLYQYDLDNFIQIKNKSSQKAGLSHNRVFSVMEDSGGSIWFGTLSGVNIWNPLLANFEHFRQVVEDPLTLSSNTISAFAEREDGLILVGTFGGGLNYLDLSKNVIAPLVDEKSKQIGQKRITSIMLDNQQRIWTGSVTEGIEIFSSKLDKVTSLKAQAGRIEALSANGITDLLMDSRGYFWAATYGGGVNQISPQLDQFTHFKASSSKNKSLASDRVHQLIEDSQGFIWAATDGGGISKIDPGTGLVKNFLKIEDDPESLSSNSAWTIFEDSHGRFWIGTQGNGLNRWEKSDRINEKQIFKHYNIENSLASNTINGVLEDYSGNLWISTNRGVTKLNPVTDQVEHFNLSSDLHYNEFNLGVMLRARSGRMFFGGLKGISTFKPENISKNNHVPNVVLTKVISQNQELNFGKPIHQLDEIIFDHDDYFVAFEFASLDFAQPEKNQYQYKLEGLDEGWIRLGTQNRATFISLPSGSYILKVKGSNNDGVWSEESINLKINVLPAPWFSWWAFSIYGGFFCLVILFVIRFQARKLANQELFKERVSGEVEEKTALYLSNNEYLERQLARAKHQSFFDADANLPNQRFMMTQLSPLIQLLSLHEEGQPARKLMISLIGFKATANVSRESAAQCFSLLAKEKESTQTLASWGSEALFCQEVLSEDAEGQASLNQLVNSIHAKVKVSGISDICYVAFELPFSGVQTSPIESDEYLMLLEHLLYLVAHSQQHSSFYITGALQNLNSSKIRQILDSKDIAEIDELFILKSA